VRRTLFILTKEGQVRQFAGLGRDLQTLKVQGLEPDASMVFDVGA